MNVLVPLMQGFEEIEFISIVDTLRRANINVLIARDSSIENDLIKGAHDIVIKAESKLCDISLSSIQGIVLAGGYEGMLNLKNSTEIISIIRQLNDVNKLVAAICASPIVLGEAEVLKNKFSCYPSCEKFITSNAVCCDEVVCVDNNIITSIGPASGILFALQIVKYLKGSDEYDKIKAEMLVDKIIK